MKTKTFFRIVIVMFFCNILNAQVDFPMEDARWCYYKYDDTGNDLGYHCFSPSELVEVNGITYSNITYRRHHLENEEEILYRAEDNRVYVLPQGFSNEILIYDFNLIEGDTFETNWGFGLYDSITLVVQNIDTIVTLDGVSRKRFTLENDITGHFGEWLEGIGDRVWVFVYPAYLVSLGGGYILQCHNQGDSLIYSQSSTCELIDDVEEIPKQLSFEIYPNPIGDNFNIDLKNINAKNLTIRSHTGQVVFEKEIETHQNVLQISNQFKAGIYFVNIYLKDGFVLTKKMVRI